MPSACRICAIFSASFVGGERSAEEAAAPSGFAGEKADGDVCDEPGSETTCCCFGCGRASGLTLWSFCSTSFTALTAKPGLSTVVGVGAAKLLFW